MIGDCFEAGAEVEKVDGFLQKYGLWFSPMSLGARYRRYSKLCKVTFDCVPYGEWGRCM